MEIKIIMGITKQELKQIILEELSKSDKVEIKKMIETELKKLLKKRETEKIIVDLTKKVMNTLLTELSFNVIIKMYNHASW